MGSNDDHASVPKHLGDYPHGAYFATHSPPRANAGEPADANPVRLDITVRGNVITMMWDYGVRVPLWDSHGLLPDDPRWLRAVLRLSDSLIEDLTSWGSDMLELDAAPSLRTQEAYEDLDVRAQGLAQRLQQELGFRYTVRYRAW